MWFRKHRKLRAPDLGAPGESSPEGRTEALIRALAAQVSSPAARERMKSSIEKFIALKPHQQDGELPVMLLMIEEALAGKLGGLRIARTEIRRFVEKHFRSLLAFPDFALIFAPPREQETLLCRQFLIKVLDKVFEFLGAAGGDRIAALSNWLRAAPSNLPPPRLVGTGPVSGASEGVALFTALSHELHEYLDAKVGQQRANAFFESGYQEIFARFGKLDTFSVLVKVRREEPLQSVAVHENPLKKASSAA